MATELQEESAVARPRRLPARVPPFLYSVRWRLSLVLTAIILLSTAVCVLTAVIFLQRALTDRAKVDLQHTLNGASVYLGREQKRLLGAAELVSADPMVGVSLHRRQRLVNRLTPYYGNLNVDTLDIVDRTGHVVVGLEDPSTYGYSAMRMPDIQQALAGQTWVGLDHNPRSQVAAAGWAIRASVPLVGPSGIKGAVVVGRQLDSTFAADLGGVLNADVNLIVGRKRTGSTETDSLGLPVVGVTEPPSIRARMSTGYTSIVQTKEAGRDVLSGIVPIDDAHGRWIGAVEVVRPLSPLYSVISGLSLLLLACGVLIVIGGTVVALYVGRRLTRRLLLLEEATSEVMAQPEETAPLRALAHTLPVHGKDEVASLARSFSAMMEILDERMTANARLYAASEARVKELSGLADVGRPPDTGSDGLRPGLRSCHCSHRTSRAAHDGRSDAPDGRNDRDSEPAGAGNDGAGDGALLHS